MTRTWWMSEELVTQGLRAMVPAGYTGGRGKKGTYDFYEDVLSKW